MKKAKRLTSKSGITIPKDMRAEAGYFPGMAVDMETLPGGGILIKPHVAVCRFCGRPDDEPEDVRIIMNIPICTDCRKALRKELDRFEKRNCPDGRD